MTWPLTPGHDAGTVAELGEGVEGFEVGDRVAVGWFGGNCNRCIPCRKGKFMQCEAQVPSLAYPGGYAESIDTPRPRWPASPTSRRSPMRLRWAAQGSPPSTACARPGPTRVTSSRCSASAASATSGCSSPVRWASRPSPSPGAQAKPDAAHSAPITTSTRGGRRRAELKKLGGASSCSRPRPARPRSATVAGLAPRVNHHRRRHAGAAADQPAGSHHARLKVSGHPSGTARDVEETLHFAMLSGVRADRGAALAEAAEAYRHEDRRAHYRGGTDQVRSRSSCDTTDNWNSREEVHAHRYARGLCRDARPRKGALVRVPRGQLRRRRPSMPRSRASPTQVATESFSSQQAGRSSLPAWASRTW